MSITRTLFWAFLVVFAGALGWMTFEWYRSDVVNSEAAYGVPFELTDQNGAKITEAAMRGKPTALFFGFTHCPEVCPTTLWELNAWMEEVDPNGDKLNGVFVSVDPERDTPEILGDYVSSVSNRIIGITGEPEAVFEAVRGYNIFYRKVPLDAKDPEGDYTMDHTASVILLDKDGRFEGTIAYGENPETAVKKLQNLLNG